MKRYFNGVVFASLFLIFLPHALYAQDSAGFPGRPWGDKEVIKGLQTLAIQNRGRVKPFDTFAREAVEFVTGKRYFSGWNPVELTLSWFSDADRWKDAEIIVVRDIDARRVLNLDSAKTYFAPNALLKNKALLDRIESNFRKKQRNEAFTKLDEKIEQIEIRISAFQSISTGANWFIIPNSDHKEGSWRSINDTALPEEIRSAFQGVVLAYDSRNSSGFLDRISELKNSIRDSLRDKSFYPTTAKMNLEVHYNTFSPFKVAWILYLSAFVFLLLSLGFSWRGFSLLGISLALLGFASHAYGFILRCLIAGRPPVTNMFETVIWVTWGAFLFALILYAIYKNRILITVASGVVVIGLILADNIPAVMDPTINPLAPVLRSNFWLTIHVLTINLGYAGMALAAGLGNVVMGRVLFGAPSKEVISSLTKLTYRAMQIGLVLLTAGTILGGVWADKSWGRFWGWDPKEVWALIAILTYLAILHGRHAGWLKEFGVAAGGALGFLTIMMAWYGVNFILGVGLHSYGFGSGGTGYVFVYAFLQIAFVLASAFRWRLNKEFN